MSMLMLPDDVAFHILSFLPVKSLLRLRCLSKSCCSLIDSPDFINFHLNLSIKRTTNRCLIFNDFDSIYEIDLDSTDMRAVKISVSNRRRHIFGTCNGLVAMGDDRGIILWNPSTNKNQIVAKFWTGDVCFSNGFGYDVITNDYKVIIITRDYHDNKNYSVMVYSLKTNSSKRIHSSPPSYYLESDWRLNSVLVGFYVHWVVADDEFDYNTMILAFDLENEKFNEVPIPDVVFEGDKSIIKMVAELGGCLSINYMQFYQEQVDVWIMKEYGVKESWTKLFSVSKVELGRAYNYFGTFVPLCFTKEGEKVLCSSGSELVYILYDLKNRRVEIVNDISKSIWFEKLAFVKTGVICVSSLVPLDVNNAEETIVVRSFEVNNCKKTREIKI